ncbi:MAG TPA: efflux RND transporter periplasmic adaptor subunit [Candidatus Sulfotelmatobacter sp.]|nr:efflux RND transporter periplasmic adaptor subunit [Candidatus Sulfotelmatobacter sp.]
MNALKLTFACAGLLLLSSCAQDDKSSAKAAAPEAKPKVEVVRVVSQKLAITVHLPGEIEPYEVVSIFPKVTGFVKSITVDRGSHVRAGELMAQLEAPELAAQRSEAQSRLQAARAQLAAVEAKVASDESTYEHLKSAAATPGVVAGNDLFVAQKTTEADRAQLRSQQENVGAAQQALKAVTETEGYLQVKAPFDGIVTERNVHPGALVGPAGGAGAASPMLRIETLSRLRVVVPVPENYAAGVPQGAKVDFTVPAFPGRIFHGTIARISHSVDVKTRTMPVELEAANPKGELSPGTFSDVLWPVRRSDATLFVPASAVATTLEHVFVVRIRDGKAEWVDVKTGATVDKLSEVFGDLHEGDMVATRGTDELRPGTAVSVQGTAKP